MASMSSQAGAADQARSITMGKTTLQEVVYLNIAMMDEDSETYSRFCGIMLCALGIVQPDGSLSAQYAQSPLWTLSDDNVLMPSVQADIASIVLGDDLSAEHVSSVMRTLGVDMPDADAVHDTLTSMAMPSGAME